MFKKMIDLFKRIKPFIPTYLLAIAIPVTVGLISAFLTKDNMSVYSQLNSPPLSPPAILFPIVWTLLFILMGISSAMIYTDRIRNPEAAKRGLCLYLISLVLNFSWSIIFFNLQAAFFALLVLIALIIFVIKTILEYRKINTVAAYLQIPYLLWILFACYLNAGIWLLN